MLFSAAFTASLSLIGLEASDISVSPIMNLLNPPPVPEIPTFTLTFLYSLLNSSAIASEIG